MSNFLVKNFGSLPDLKDPVLIEGLPGIGSVARVSIDFLIDKLGAIKFLEVYSDVFPNSVTITDDSLIKMFSVEFYHAHVNNQDIILVSGEVQPSGDSDSYALCRKIISIASKLGVKDLITIGGIGLPEEPDKVKVHCVVTDLAIIDSIKGLGVVFDGCDTVKIILGVSGLLLGVGSLNGLKGFSLLAETFNQPQHVGVREAREVLKIIDKHLSLALDFKDLDDEIKGLDDDLKSDKRFNSDVLDNRSSQGYIG